MTIFRRIFNRFISDDEGQTTVEYAVMLSMIVSVSGMSMDVLGYRVNAAFTQTAVVLDGEIPSDSDASSPLDEDDDSSSDDAEAAAAQAAAAAAAAQAAAEAAAQAAAVEAAYQDNTPKKKRGHGRH